MGLLLDNEGYEVFNNVTLSDKPLKNGRLAIILSQVDSDARYCITPEQLG